ncbi:uncharacterized protein HD556DRAFT_1447661 [Suillus plorans]|uniref:Uncharacterized protein n=1 Tax=Suillus plorans TaxID=116603 RepID=A0A9P7AH07_9AGAM|nr:uncharacterized protein HD556DRAFT_1447661 [Suillus plorans]KAG1788630.1 hypothetical protein HD556DRAFT_1447661 [Suillus plorans]
MPTQPGPPPPLPVGDASSHPRLCAVPGCKFTRIAPDCKNLCCRKHCVAFGGCSSKTHKPTPAESQRNMAIDPVLRVPPSQPAKAGPSAVHSAPTPSPTISLNVQAPTSSAVAHTPSQLPTSSGATYTPSQVPTPAIAHASSEGRSYPSNKGKDRALPPSEVDIHANPRYPSQLPPVFTQRYAEQEQQLKATAHQAAKQRNLEHRMKNTVEVYGWSKDGAEVTMCEFQEGITLPQFKVTVQVLRALGLCSGDDAEAQQGHALMLDSRQVYMRTIGVTITPEFDNIFESNSLHVVPNIRTNLKAERAAVRLSNTRTQLRAASIAASDSEDPEDMRKHKHSGHSLRGNARRVRTNTAGSSAVRPYSPALIIKHERTLLTPRRSFSIPNSPPLAIKHEHTVDANLQDVIELFSDSGSEVDVNITPRQHVPHPSRHRSLSSDSSHSASSDSSSLSDPSTVSECSSLSSGHSPEDAVDVDAFDNVRRWPTSFYACEIADGFKKYDKSRRVGLCSHAAFSLAFGGGVHFRPLTFSEHRKRWDQALASSRTMFIRAGKSDAGSYSAFMKANPLPGADVKAAQKRLGRLRG